MKIPATQWWHVEGEKIVCDLCPRECKLQDGQRGFCFVRQNVGMDMVLTTYGKSTGFCIDPIEKKPLNHFLPGTPVLSFGTAGCNLGCKFCQNWDISKSREIEILSQTASPEAIVEAAKKSGCRSIAFTYNDPVIWAEYAIETAKVARQAGIKTVAVTAGYITPAARPAFYEYMDAANVDLKAFTDLFYRKVTFAHLDPVLETLRWLKHESSVWFEITNLMIPGENDSPDETQRMCDWILENLGPNVPVHFSGFHPDFKMRDKPNTPRETLLTAREIAKKTGIKFAYVGNVLAPEGQSTACPKCHALLIERNHYHLGHYAIRDGRCAQCGEAIPGVFENQRGDWGRKRLPVKIQDTTPPAPIAYTPEQVDALLKFARGVVEATVRNEAPAPLPAALALAPEFGMFVTLRRGKHLRGCLGHWSGDEPETLGALIQKSASKVASFDSRFPPIHEAELPHLTVEISPMFALAPVAETGENREKEVRVGEHGLLITHPQGRGLLLPQVATEQGWDARTFLNQVCVKAGLPKDAWKRPETTLSTFRGRHYVSEAPKPEFDPARVPATLWAEVLRYAAARLAGGEAEAFPDLPQAASFPPGGIMLQGAHGLTALAFRPGASLRELVDQGCASLLQAAQNQGKTIDRVLRLLCFSHPLPLRPEDDPRRRRGLGKFAVAGRLGAKFSFSLGQSNDSDPVQQTLKGLEVREADWKSAGAALLAYRIFAVNANETPAAASASTRPAAVAGKFYPGDPQAIREELRRYSQPAVAARFDAVLLPHAGWRFCGEIMAETLAGVTVPDLVVVIGPKHTRHGPDWSISAATTWKLPHAEIPVATEWVKFLADRVAGLVCENGAHREEHGCEVLLPFLHHRNPALRVVPIVIGSGTPEELQPLSKALSQLRGAMPDQPPLLVVSSDMNHFANDTENRRLDHLALDQLKASNPNELFAVCQRERISMCGLRPAVAVLQALGKCEVNVVRYDTSASVSGDSSRVVGYAGATIRVKT